MTIICSHLTNVVKSSITIVSINMTTFSNTQVTVFCEILSLLYNENICPHLTNVIKSVKTIFVDAMTTFSNTQDEEFREILSLVK